MKNPLESFGEMAQLSEEAENALLAIIEKKDRFNFSHRQTMKEVSIFKRIQTKSLKNVFMTRNLGLVFLQ